MRLLLDTHILLWWLGDPEKLSSKALHAIADAATLVCISAATAWEISIKKALGKLQAPDNLEEALRMSRFQHLSVTVSHGWLAGQLPKHHEDPFDRLLIAQASLENLTLVTHDHQFKAYDVQLF